ncbi:zinc finger and SCAN domain-containing protein 5A [Rhagoletis pomonella]|uniref:zinc finger and SCAN domain-containing protein 5A n=1 Tax=Rhagoletis pomonella TaxID=28610 RepID=UPI0017821B7C|nr:zinc finger and SCAN domain-containing protein 5A [Rhagoletis pomonella]
MSSELIEEGGGIDAGSDEALLTNGANETDEGVAEYLEEHDPMAAEKPVNPTKRGRKPRRPVEVEEAEEGNVEALEEDNDGEVIEEMLEEEEEAEDGENVKPVLRKLTQLPKKRKDEAVQANSNRKSNDETYVEDDEQPTSTAREAAKIENQVDENQCRVCTSKEALVSLFNATSKQTIADKLMIICPTVSIAQKDFMPQFICNPCLDKVNIALELKTQCETTERELRKKLSRSKNKVRRPAGYVVIDATLDSDPSDEEPNDDVEFKVSDEGGITAEDDSDDSDFGSPKKKRSPRVAAAKRGKRKSAAATPAPKVKEKKRVGGRPASKRSLPSPEVIIKEESSDEDEEPKEKQVKKRKTKNTPQSDEAEDKPSEFPCDECEQVFARKLSLILHKKAHNQRQPIKCETCGQIFKIQGAYRKHVQKHTDEPSGFECSKCEYTGSSKAELRRHLVEEHDEQGVLHQCEKCKRKFVSEARLEKHKEGRCPGVERVAKIRLDVESYTVGKDLFKAVAPLTTTYWSDSFSD